MFAAIVLLNLVLSPICHTLLCTEPVHESCFAPLSTLWLNIIYMILKTPPSVTPHPILWLLSTQTPWILLLLCIYLDLSFLWIWNYTYSVLIGLSLKIHALRAIYSMMSFKFYVLMFAPLSITKVISLYYLYQSVFWMGWLCSFHLF